MGTISLRLLMNPLTDALRQLQKGCARNMGKKLEKVPYYIANENENGTDTLCLLYVYVDDKVSEALTSLGYKRLECGYQFTPESKRINEEELKKSMRKLGFKMDSPSAKTVEILKLDLQRAANPAQVN